jgi:hypothetical protein
LPSVDLLSFHKKPLSHLMSSSSNHARASATNRRCIGLVEITDLIRIKRPTLAISPLCQAGTNYTTVSNIGYHSFVRSRRDNCNPYLIGNWPDCILAPLWFFLHPRLSSN